MKKQFLETGKITGTHGIRGMVRIQPWCDDIKFLTKIKNFYLDDKGAVKLEKERIAPNGNVFIAKFKGIDTVADAEKYREKVIYINRNEAKIEEGSYFIQDIIDCKVYNTQNGDLLGVIGDVSQTGANDVWHIVNDTGEYLIPVIDDIVNKVDIEKGEIFITPMKGIFDDED
ncbi:MAG: 16S rRNA processing protein RimM [Clostridia bacterium]|nr:16S rRNA processing protein RimM [Clostridia bacterium]